MFNEEKKRKWKKCGCDDLVLFLALRAGRQRTGHLPSVSDRHCRPSAQTAGAIHGGVKRVHGPYGTVKTKQRREFEISDPFPPFHSTSTIPAFTTNNDISLSQFFQTLHNVARDPRRPTSTTFGCHVQHAPGVTRELLFVSSCSPMQLLRQPNNALTAATLFWTDLIHPP